uniref:Uncharacterized protein n=1 Tax=Palpitomonas bilix TaxID=652834 RepID=A0A7S3GHV0_9EUKA|mmetsp:Transcript_50196/g.129200  ORF Transcript_50196/g.129200 Transcript_50196/m.129200 type:complete len:139 (+) Transcript_50196:344-760(+)
MSPTYSLLVLSVCVVHVLSTSLGSSGSDDYVLCSCRCCNEGICAERRLPLSPLSDASPPSQPSPLVFRVPSCSACSRYLCTELVKGKVAELECEGFDAFCAETESVKSAVALAGCALLLVIAITAAIVSNVRKRREQG